mmetsp:Transcript_7610/g.16574  ORF Transcript_7610/g.16574 Transcript_7610/m.16574 type:complete len:174 (-) Transcript_7610:618-1139(-)
MDASISYQDHISPSPDHDEDAVTQSCRPPSIFHGGIDGASAFLPAPAITRAIRPGSAHGRPISPPSPRRPIVASPSSAPIHSASDTRLRSFFGLGPAELAIIIVAGLVVVGPSKLLDFSREAGSVAGKSASGLGDEWSELKAIPEEFQKGVEEGEIEARSRKAKAMEEVDKNE